MLFSSVIFLRSFANVCVFLCVALCLLFFGSSHEGIANLVADGMAMGLGEFVGEKAELEYATRELSREKWEFDNYPEGISVLYLTRQIGKDQCV
jgi:hypothetical protein